VTSVIPHRAPFLMVDSVVELREGYLASVRLFRKGEPFFGGHFPDHPLVPGVLLIEGLAQTMAYYALFHDSVRRVFLVGIEHARFHSPVEPETEVTYQVELAEDRFGILTGHGRVTVGDRRVATATLKGFAGNPGAAL
jgi:3-hydroxymyristoyl/3-hydroxydecanoyl-(acyl carrier protein) dehydratase